jgi:hypothetical protein
MSKFKVKLKEVSAVGGVGVVLCWPDGEPVEGQLKTVVETGVGGVPTVTVTFAIDGTDICFER